MSSEEFYLLKSDSGVFIPVFIFEVEPYLALFLYIKEDPFFFIVNFFLSYPFARSFKFPEISTATLSTLS